MSGARRGAWKHVEGAVRCGFICLALAVSACGPKPAISFNRGAANDIQPIGVLDPKVPDRATASIRSVRSGYGGGLIGLAVASVESRRDDRLTASLTRQGFNVKERFLARLDVALQDAGYRVVRVPNTRDNTSTAFLSVYPPASPGGPQSYLDLVLHEYGYVASSALYPYQPYVVVSARLVRARDSSVLMEHIVAYNGSGRFMQANTTIPADPKFDIDDSDTFIAQPDVTAAGLQAAMDAAADAVAALLR